MIDFGGDCEGIVLINIMYIWISEGNLVDINDVMGIIVVMFGSIGLSFKISFMVFLIVELMVMNICVVVLLVELMNFIVKLIDCIVLLEWVIVFEFNNDFIVVECSIDVKYFEEIGWRVGIIEL